MQIEPCETCPKEQTHAVPLYVFVPGHFEQTFWYKNVPVICEHKVQIPVLLIYPNRH